MKMSQSFSQTMRQGPSEAEVASHQLLLRAGFVRQLAAGIFSVLHLGRRTQGKIEAIMRQEIDRIGGQEIAMPVVHPADLWQESGRWYKIDQELGRFGDKNGRDMVLALSHEEIATELAGHEIRSYRQLPQLIYHIQTKWRDDPRPRAGLIRAREFTMLDSYSLDADEAGLDRQYQAHCKAYFRIFGRCALPVIAVEGDVGMMGGTMAHEFMYLTPIGEDTVLLCAGCGYQANRQIVNSGRDLHASTGSDNACPRCGQAMRAERGVEVANIFKLGTRYSQMMDATFVDASGETRPIVMGSYGIGVGRLLACIAEHHRDEQGLVWPIAVAPYQVHLVALRGGEEAAGSLYYQLQMAGIEVLYEDRDESPGVKFNDADLIGLPVRLTVSRRSLEQGGVEIRLRHSPERIVVPLAQTVTHSQAQIDNLEKAISINIVP